MTFEPSTPVESPTCQLSQPITLDGLPSREFQSKLATLLAPMIDYSVDFSQVQWAEEMLPIVKRQLHQPKRRLQLLDVSSPESQTIQELLQSALPLASQFPVSLSEPKGDSALATGAWIVEFMVIGSTNGLLRPDVDEWLHLFVREADELDALDEF